MEAPLVHDDPGVDVEVRSGDCSGCVGSKKHGGVGDVPRFGQAVQRRLAGETGFHFSLGDAPRGLAWAEITQSSLGPATKPGEMRFTRTPNGPASMARVRVNPTRASLDGGVRRSTVQRPLAADRPDVDDRTGSSVRSFQAGTPG